MRIKFLILAILLVLAGCEVDEPEDVNSGGCGVGDDSAMIQEAIDLAFSESNGLIYITDARLCTDFIIHSEGGGFVEIDCSGKEVVVRGATEAGAKVFFEGFLKSIIDEYIKAALNELCPREGFVWLDIYTAFDPNIVVTDILLTTVSRNPNDPTSAIYYNIADYSFDPNAGSIRGKERPEWTEWKNGWVSCNVYGCGCGRPMWQ